jgi:aspartyl-tRNA(Asn)/glutamyl-tRNA(Gln) amidotransferase subunit B
MTWQTVIGLEVHAQLKTCSKLFSGTATTYGAPPNSQTSFIDAGLPGVLPVLNQEAVRIAIQFGLAINAEINDHSFFERKNYFYPDLPKGYQISQFQRPIVGNGYLEIDSGRKIHIVRAHLEEDAGKSLHDINPIYTGIDLNRAGTPLLEIVTAPCLFSASEAISYLKTLHQLLQFLGICDGNMQEGSFRCDVNLSLKPENREELGTRTELKNLNSFRFIEKAIYYEQARHQDILEAGQQVIQETRLYCPDTNTTQVLRSKENENDYRYFPDPDLLPIHISPEYIATINANMPACPADIRKRLQDHDKLVNDNVDFLLSSRAVLAFYNEVKRLTHAEPKTIVNWLKGTYMAALHSQNLSFEQPPVSAKNLACLLDRLTDNTIPNNLAKDIFTKLLQGADSVDELIASSGYKADSIHAELDKIIRAIIKNNPQQAADYRAGKEKLLAFFVGQVMKQTKGQADPAQINILVRKALSV